MVCESSISHKHSKSTYSAGLWMNEKGRHDTEHKDIQHNDTQHKDNQNNSK